MSELMQQLLLEHLRGPVAVVANEAQRQVTRRALLQKGLIRPHPSPQGNRFTAITAIGVSKARALLLLDAA